MTRRLWLRSALLLVSSVVVTLAFIEVLLHVFPGLVPATIRYRDVTRENKMGLGHAYIGHLHTPDTSLLIATPDFQIAHRTDDHGFRNAKPWPEQADIVVVGDSLTFGYGVADGQAWPSLVADAFPQLKIVNLGLIGTGPEQQVRVYETFGKPLHPRLLIVGFFWGNDFWDTGLFDRWLKSGDGDNYMIWRNFGGVSHTDSRLSRAVSQVKGWLQRHSILYLLLAYTRDAYREWRSNEPVYYQTADGAKLQLWPSDFVENVQKKQPGEVSFDLAVQAFTRLQKMAQEQDMQVLVVLQPSKEQVYLPLLGEDLSHAGESFRAALKRLEIDYFDLTPVFREHAAEGEALFYQVDGHPNPKGYQLIAQEVANYLKKMVTTYGVQVQPGRTRSVQFRTEP